MAINFEDYQKFSKEQMEAVQAAATEVSKQLQAIAAETTDYSKKSLESGSAFVEKLLGVKKLDEAIALQQEFAKTSYEGFVAQTTKLGELYANVAKEAFKPVEGAIAKVKSVDHELSFGFSGLATSGWPVTRDRAFFRRASTFQSCVFESPALCGRAFFCRARRHGPARFSGKMFAVLPRGGRRKSSPALADSALRRINCMIWSRSASQKIYRRPNNVGFVALDRGRR